VDWVTTRLRSALTVAFALGICGPAAAAQITTDRPCYETPSSGTVRVAITATGLDPAQFYTVTLDDRQVASGTTPGTGTVTAQVDVARLAARQNTVNHSVVVTQGANTATTTFGVARLRASFTPTIGNPTTMRVRFSVTGFALRMPRPDVFVHEISPTGHAVRTLFIGRATGPCGTIATTTRRRLFAVNPRHGIWRLQFDTNRVYHRARPSMLFYMLPVTVSGPPVKPPPGPG
jgi:hypothetical protein